MGLSIDVYVMVHNELRILPYFYRHYGQFARRFFVFEDQSSDGSREFLERQPNTTIIEPAVHGIAEDYWIAKLWPLYEQYSRGIADYVIQVDADEFVYHPNLLRVLEREKRQGRQLIQCRGYVMVADKFPTGSGQIYEYVKTGLPCKLSTKYSIFDPAITLRYRHGQHRIQPPDPGVARNKPGIKLLHYRLLGEEHIDAHDRVVQERLNLFNKVDKPYDHNWHRRLPDNSKGSMLTWYTKHKAEAQNVVD